MAPLHRRAAVAAAVACVCAVLTSATATTPEKRRFIFAFNPGYSGSGFLRLVLNSSDDVTCFHEKPPALVDFRWVLMQGLNETYDHRRSIKVPSLRKDLDEEPFASKPEQVYCDTSHLFAKSWYDVFADEFLAQGHEVHIIHLKRYLPDAARSALGVGKRAWKPAPHHQVGGEYQLPNFHFTLLKNHEEPTKQDSLDLIIGYLLDMEAQFIKVQQQYPNFKVHDFYLDTAADERMLRQLFKALNVTFSPATQKISQKQHFNSHTSSSQRSVDPIAYRARVLAYIEARRMKKLPVPPLPHMDRFEVYVDPDTGVAMPLAIPSEPLNPVQVNTLVEKYNREVFQHMEMNEQPNTEGYKYKINQITRPAGDTNMH